MKSFNVCNIYLVLCVLMAFSGRLYSGGGLISQSIQAVFILISLYYVLYDNQMYKLPAYFKGLNVLLVMFTIYGVLLILSGDHLIVKFNYHEAANTGYLKSIYKSLLPIYAFYAFARKGWLTEKKVRLWVLVFLVVSVMAFFNAQAAGLRVMEERGSTSEEFTINTAYAFVGILPGVLLFYRRPLIQYTLLAVCVFFIIYGMKRGAILAGGVATFILLYNNLKHASRRQRFIVLIVSALALLFIVLLVQYMMATSDYFNYRIAVTEEGGSSGRDELYVFFLKHFVNDNNLLTFILGNGANATLKIGVNYAHNDFLEIAINQGLLGLVIYLSYWIGLFRSWRQTQAQSRLYLMIGVFFVIYLLISFFSMSYNSVTRCAAMVFGYSLAMMAQVKVNSPQ